MAVAFGAARASAGAADLPAAAAQAGPTTLQMGTITITAADHPKVYQQDTGSFDTIETLISMVSNGANEEWAPVCGILLSHRGPGGGNRVVRLFLKWDEVPPGMLAQLMHGHMVMDEDDLTYTFEQNQVLRIKLTWRNGRVAISLNGSSVGNVRYDFPIDSVALYSDNAKCTFAGAELSTSAP
jgi:hypothetical protein